MMTFLKKSTGADTMVDDTNNPLPVTLAGAGSSTVATNIAQYGGTNVSATNPFNVTGAVQALSTSLDWFLTGDLQTGALTDTIKTAAGASLYNTCSWVTISAGTLGAAATVSIKNGAGGTVLWQLRLQTGGGLIHMQFPTPLISSANTLLEIATTDPTSGLIYWAAGGAVTG